ncbi:hypothetical protein RND71_013929 [Anisodus tanguticus]|uniref:Uncharacterized protein n=1 Tax=Anisodus tanguticus TaxID=243964 RepID=A0AAE1SAD4_9SOLA|nr:hypothetical protein RND71_013929 [Anisodus tanguticus]
MALMRSLSIDYSEYYDSSDVIIDVFFCSALLAIYDYIMVNSAAIQRSIEDVLKEYKFIDQILDYVTGDHLQSFGMSWVGELMFCGVVAGPLGLRSTLYNGGQKRGKKGRAKSFRCS